MPKHARRTSIAFVMLPMLGLAMTSCQTRTIATTDDVCLIWTPLTYSVSGDTAETVDGIRGLNARRDAYCG